MLAQIAGSYSVMPISSAPSDRPSLSFRALLALLIAIEFVNALESSMIYAALSKLYGVYGDPAHVGWLVTAYLLACALSSALCSRLGDLYGRRRMLLLMLGVAVVGSAISAVATDLNVIIFGRALQGATFAIMPLAFGILRENAKDSRDLNLGVGILGGTFALSNGVGIILGGLIVDNTRWQHIFTVSASAALVVLLVAVRYLPKGNIPPKPERLDLPGALFVIPISALLLALTNGKSLGWDSPVVVALLAFAVVSLVGWVLYELRQANPLIDVRLLGNPTIAIVNTTIFFTAMAPMIYPIVILPLMQQPLWTGIGFGISATMAGVIKLPTNLTSGLAGIGSGLFARRYSMRPAIILAASCNLLAYTLLIFFHDSMLFVAAVCIFLIAPSGVIIFGSAPGLIIEAAPAERTSEATGLTAMLRSLSTAMGTQLIAYCLATSSISNSEGLKFPDERA
jgi:MFS family permease